MSATGRKNGNGYARHPNDFFATPKWVTRALFDCWFYERVSRNNTIVDPACGDGAILDLAQQLGYKTFGMELDPERAEKARAKGHQVEVRDALDADPWHRGVIILNPPFSKADEFVRRACEEAQGMTVAALVRLNFLATRKRRDLHDDFAFDVFVLTSRPSFTGKGTDACDYAWVISHRHADRRWRRIEMYDVVD